MITKETRIHSVTVIPEDSIINVRWDVCIIEDGTVISRNPHRKAYGEDQLAEFLAEVEGAASYLVAVGW